VLKINYKITKKLTVKRRYTYCIINYINHDARYVAIDRSKTRKWDIFHEPNYNHRSVTFEKRFIRIPPEPMPELLLKSFV